MIQMFKNMDVQPEDTASVILTLCLLLIWYLTFVVFNYPLLSLLFLWAGMIILSLVYLLVYKKKKRNMHIFKIRFYVSAIPIYSALAFYVYILIYGQAVPGIVRYMPIGIIGTMLLLNAGVVYWFSKNK
jgi:hypothetical protein